jgi:uncharacterized protein YdeI (YjbR/CyaY-like superfamily)
MTTDINIFFLKGCGRCAKYDTPLCKLNNWKEELLLLRNIILKINLTETMKWGMPCYQFEGANILMIAPFKDNCIVSFFKGSLLKKHYEILQKAGENSEQARVIKFKNKSEISQIENEILDLINESIEIEKAGIKVQPKTVVESDFPVELLNEFELSVQFKNAFNKLTNGKKRGYLIYFNTAKQSSTRLTRIKKHIPNILSGKGINE